MRRKGFVHAIEGVIASLMIIGYLSQFVVLPIQQTNWPQNTLNQEGREFLTALNEANLTYLISENKGGQISSIAKSVLGKTIKISLTTEGLLKPDILVGVLINETDQIKVTDLTIDSCPEGIISEHDCLSHTADSDFPRDFIIVDNDTNNRIDYETAYIDLNNNHDYDLPLEGPMVINQIFRIDDTYYTIGTIDKRGRYATFWNANNIVILDESIATFNLNDRETKFAFVGASNETELSIFDALIVIGYQNLTKISDKLSEYKNGIIGLVNLTEERMDSVQEDIFGLRWNTYDYTTFADDKFKLQNVTPNNDIYQLNQYFSHTPFYLDTIWIEAEDFDTFVDWSSYEEPNPEYSNNNAVRGESASDYIEKTLILPATGTYYIWVRYDSEADRDFTITFDSSAPVYFDTGDGVSELKWKDFTYTDSDRVLKIKIESDHADDNDAIIDAVVLTTNNLITPSGKNKVTLNSNNYILKKSDSSGGFAEFLVEEGHKFDDILPSQTKVYSKYNSSDYIALQYTNGYYKISTYSIGHSETVTMTSFESEAGMRLPAGEHTKGEFLGYNVVATNYSIKYNVLNIDLNENNVYNDEGEGPFSKYEFVRIGPEYFNISIEYDGSKTKWYLDHRWKIPAAIANLKEKTVWMPNTINGADGRNFLRSAICWASNKKSELLKETIIYRTSSAVSDVFVVNKDMFQPYIVNLKLWYYV